MSNLTQEQKLIGNVPYGVNFSRTVIQYLRFTNQIFLYEDLPAQLNLIETIKVHYDAELYKDENNREKRLDLNRFEVILKFGTIISINDQNVCVPTFVTLFSNIDETFSVDSIKFSQINISSDYTGNKENLINESNEIIKNLKPYVLNALSEGLSIKTIQKL